MAVVNQHSKCARCRDNGLGSDPCVLKTDCEFCTVLIIDQKSQVITPTYKARKDNKNISSPLPSLLDPGSVQILGQVNTSSEATHEY